ncbi:MAG: hypothetical protein F6K36_23970, partial [Symploca sp. SIO3C6]|nr:hypothetical protein [Symploca sp. SIO3C6]NET08011.1 hypothetical protein [Symploca sp. SIO2B6]
MANIRIEGEDLLLNGYFIKNESSASNGKYIGLLEPGNLTPGATGTASYNFSGTAGTYDIVIAYYDENDGVGQLELQVDNNSVESWALNENTGTGAANNQSLR